MRKQTVTHKRNKPVMPRCCNPANLQYLIACQNCTESDRAFLLKVKYLRRSGSQNRWYGPLSAKEVIELAKEIQNEGKLVICDIEPDSDWRRPLE